MVLDEIVNSYKSHVKIKKKQNIYRELISPASRVCFSNNDYLGLAQHPVLISAAKKACELYGVGAQASRILGAYNDHYLVFEKEIATSKNQESALIFASGFQANVSVIAALLDRQILSSEPLVFSDRLNHASMHLGCAAAQVRQIRYAHLDLDHLESLLKKHNQESRPKFILTESVFGMDGDCADLQGLTTLCQKYGAFLYVDEAHATGLYGPQGYGLTSPWGNHVGLAMGTFSKALGSFGAYVAGNEAIVSYLVNRCAGFIYTTALPLSVLASAQTGWQLIPQLSAQRHHIATLSQYLKDELKSLGLDTGRSTTHIIPIILQSSERTLKAQELLLNEGIKVSAIRPPTVPPHWARLRIAIRSNHTKEDIQMLLSALSRIF